MHIIPFPAPAWKPQPRTVVEIETELALLHRLLDSVPAENITGDSNTDAITAQIETIESFLTCADVVALAEDEDWEEHITSAALTAAEWLFQGDEAPSVGWLPMVDATIRGPLVN